MRIDLSKPSEMFVNLGCGRRYVAGWKNLDYVPYCEEVIQADLRKGIPIEAGGALFVYHSHVLEHLSRAEGEQFLKECSRVLCAGGVMRIVVPDLEGIARAYLAAVDTLYNESTERGFLEHEWMVAELIDQAARHTAGGEIVELAENFELHKWDFARKRFGAEYDAIIARHDLGGRSGLKGNRVKEMMLRTIRKHVPRLSEIGSAFRLGRFRMSGIVHKWMYSYCSLKHILEIIGMQGIVSRTHYESYCIGWDSTLLDHDIEKTPFKPDSMFVECYKGKA